MSNFFKDFKAVSLEEWTSKIYADLKGKDPAILHQNDAIEEIDYSSFYHHTQREKNETPGGFPFTRGLETKLNAWKNCARIDVSDEKLANERAMHKLMTGADALWFCTKKSDINWAVVLKDIQFEHIHTQFSPTSFEEFLLLKKQTEGYESNVQFNLDAIADRALNRLNLIAPSLRDKQQRIFVANGFGIQQVGATTWQEIAYALNCGHEYLVSLMNEGLTIDEASACISFHIGVGSNYFYATAKIRSLRQLWAKIVSAYTPEHSCSHKCAISAIIGHQNKSLKDPHTNLLRQTTEALSAVSAGLDQLIVLPYDSYSTEGTSELSERMALNIALILKEESYLDKVIDPMGGSYSLEQLTTKIGEKAWDCFQKIESMGGLTNDEARSWFTTEVKMKRDQRISAFEKDEMTLIGINKYQNPSVETAEWKELPDYLGIPALNFETISKNVSA